MEKTFARLATLVTDVPEHRPAALAEARELLAHIGRQMSDSSRAAIEQLTAAIDRDMDVWFGPRQWDGGATAVTMAKSAMLADLLNLHFALLCRPH